MIHCADNACTKATVLGPKNADFSIFCDATAACTDIAVFTSYADDVLFSCGGKDSCKGHDSRINCGTGMCELLFLGESSGDSAVINVNDAQGLSCVGRYAPCPDNFEPPCPIGSGQESCVAPRVWDTRTCSCDCPAELIRACGAFSFFNEQTCSCQTSCPHWAPSEAECQRLGLQWRDCECVESSYCCLSMRTQWNGMCWGETTADGCAAVLGQRCEWDAANCLPQPPVNALDPSKPCGFADAPCASDVDCCSEICKADGFCR